MQRVALLALLVGAGALFMGVHGFRVEATRHLRERSGSRAATTPAAEPVASNTPRRFLMPAVLLLIGLAGVATGITLNMVAGTPQ